MMIGPHEEKELELMLTGKKQLAAFGDIVPENGIIAEHIIPEMAFAPHVKKGELIKFEDHYILPSNHTKKQVCYTLPHEEWRAKSYMYFRKKIDLREIKYANAYDEMFGLLLGYTQDDINDFLSHSLQLNRT